MQGLDALLGSVHQQRQLRLEREKHKGNSQDASCKVQSLSAAADVWAHSPPIQAPGKPQLQALGAHIQSGKSEALLIYVAVSLPSGLSVM